MHQNFTLSVNQYQYHCSRRGTGSPVVLAHCSGSSHKQWNLLTRQLQHQYQVLAPDFLGYGESDRFNGWTLHEASDATVLEQLISEQSEPVHLVGHSYGGAMALMAAIRVPHRVRSLTLIEPVAFNVLRNTYDWQQWHQICAVADRIIFLTHQQKYKQAACEFIRYWHSGLAWWFMPRTLKTRLQKAMPKIAAEFHLMYSHIVAPDALQRLTTPVHLLCGSATTSAAKAVVNTLRDLLPDSHFSELTSCGHLAAVTRPARVNPVIINWIQSLDKAEKTAGAPVQSINPCAFS
jgi:pimeloyl-ACP methyl ester carboxylesterase